MKHTTEWKILGRLLAREREALLTELEIRKGKNTGTVTIYDTVSTDVIKDLLKND